MNQDNLSDSTSRSSQASKVSSGGSKSKRSADEGTGRLSTSSERKQSKEELVNPLLDLKESSDSGGQVQVGGGSYLGNLLGLFTPGGGEEHSLSVSGEVVTTTASGDRTGLSIEVNTDSVNSEPGDTDSSSDEDIFGSCFGSITGSIMTTKFDVSKCNITPFNGDNYAIWKYKVETLLQHLGLGKVIEEDTTDVKADQVTQVNVIFNATLTDSQLIHIMHLKTPHEKWEKLKAIHDQASSDRKQQLMSSLFSIRMDDDETVAGFLSRVNGIKYQLEVLEEKLSDTTVMALILSRLPAKFNLFVESWNQSEESVRTLVKLESKLLEAEGRINLKDPPANKNVLNTFGSGRSGRGGRGSGNFTRGGRETSQVGSDSDESMNFDGDCFYCKQHGHRKRGLLQVPKVKRKESI